MVSIRTVNNWVRYFYKRWSHLNVPLIGIIDFKNCQPSIFTDRRYWRRLSCDLKGFLEMTPERKMFFDLSISDVQRENKGYSICQILHNNDLPIIYCLFNLLILISHRVASKTPKATKMEIFVSTVNDSQPFINCCQK